MTVDAKSVIEEFHQTVNMTAGELNAWLQTEESKAVGQKESGQESIGHQSGKHIVELLSQRKADYTQDNLSQMKRVISYVHRHLAQRPSGKLEHTRWRYSLMNWGHDPLK
ncbi:MAG TPA: DUF3140 domain-containing protein [Allocoleopsis sp.]